MELLVRVTNEEIKNGTFINYSTLKEVDIQSDVRIIGDYAFAYCKALKNVNLSDKLETISHCAFINCQNLENLNIPSQVTNIGEYAFYGCHSLKEVGNLKNIIQIGASSFEECKNLKQMIIEDSVRLIDNNAFNDCNKLSLNIKTSLFKMRTDSFNFTFRVKKLTIYGENINIDMTKSYVDEELDKKFNKQINIIRRRELYDKIKHTLELNGIKGIDCYRFAEHKKIINKIIGALNSGIDRINIYDYREDLDPYLEEYIKEHKNEITLFKDVNIDDVINKINNFEVKQLESDISLSSYGNELNYVPMFIADTFEKLQFRFTKEFRVLKINEEFKKMQNKRNFLLEKLFLQANNDEIMLNKKVIMDLCIFINEEIGKCENYKDNLSKLRELVNTYVSKMNEHLTKIENFEKEENRLIIKDKIDSMMKIFIVMREFLNTIDLEIETVSHYSIKLGDVIKVHIPSLLLQVTRHRIKKNAENLSIINDISNILNMLSNEYIESIEIEENNNVKSLYKLN